MERGFTLIELLVVISIIGLLSTVVLASLNSTRTKAENAQTQEEIGSWLNAINLYQTENNKMPLETEADNMAGPYNYFYVCLGGESNAECTGSYNEDLDYYLTFKNQLSKYINFSKNPNKNSIDGYRSAYSLEKAFSTTVNFALAWSLKGVSTECAYGSEKSVYGGNTMCSLYLK
jgi:general secretion pathway protein G